MKGIVMEKVYGFLNVVFSMFAMAFIREYMITNHFEAWYYVPTMMTALILFSAQMVYGIMMPINKAIGK